MPFRNRFVTLLLFLFVWLGCTHPQPAKSEPVPPIPVPVQSAATLSTTPGPHESILPEPIFHGTVFVTETGTENPETVVLVHGAGDRASLDWEKLVPVLARRYHVLALDLPGFGRSSKGNEFYSPSRYAEILHWMAGRFVTGRFTLIGHSLGGAVALRYAADYPDDLARLILVDAAGILNRVSLTKELLLPNNDSSSRQMEAFEEFLRFTLDRVMNDDRAKKLEGRLQDASVRDRVLGGNPKKIAAMALAFEDFGPVVEQVRTPTLLVWGSRDKIAPLRTAKALAARLDARLVLIPDAGHVPMLEQPDQFNQVVLEALDSGPQRRSAAAPVQTGLDGDERIVRYDHLRGIVLTGKYKLIELDHCSDVVIRDATINRVVARYSDVVIENSTISGKGVGLTAMRSEVIGTGVTIEADTAIHADKSHLDLAGATLTGSKAAVSTNSNSVILFSFSLVKSPLYSGPLHGSWKITKKKRVF